MGWPIVASVVDALRQRCEELDCTLDDWALLQAAEAIAAGQLPTIDPASASPASAGRVEAPLRGLPAWPRPRLPFGSLRTPAQRTPNLAAAEESTAAAAG
jgi:hypothetical protein